MEDMTKEKVQITLKEMEELIMAALTASGASAANARPVAQHLVMAEAEGNPGNGIARLPTFCEHLRCKKVDGKAQPECQRVAAAALRVNAKDGFAQPAIELGFASLIPLAKENGVAGMAVFNSYNCGVVGNYVQSLSREGLLAFAFVNAPASIAPWGGGKAVFGTNPIAFAAPNPGGDPILVDQSSSVVSKGDIIMAANRGDSIPAGWGLDKQGRATTDPRNVLEGGTMVPLGGYKGSNLALIVEIMAAALTGATPSSLASSFADNTGGPCRVGQFFIALAPEVFSGGLYKDRLHAICESILKQPNTRLPGNRRSRNVEKSQLEGVSLDKALYDQIKNYCL